MLQRLMLGVACLGLMVASVAAAIENHMPYRMPSEPPEPIGEVGVTPGDSVSAFSTGQFAATLISQSLGPAPIYMSSGQVRTCTVVYDNTGSQTWSPSSGLQFVELWSVDSLGTTAVNSAFASNWRSAASITTPSGTVLAQNGSANAANSVTLQWTAPGDNQNIGTASQYRMDVSTDSTRIINWVAGDSVLGMPLPAVAGTKQSKQVLGLSPGTTYYAGIKTANRGGYWSGLSNIAYYTAASIRSSFTFSIVAPSTPGRYVLFVALHSTGMNEIFTVPVKIVINVLPAAIAHRVKYDFDGDGRADVWQRTSDGYYLIDYASNGFGSWDVRVGGYGGPNDIPCPADYDGDGKCDLAVRFADGYWRIDYASNGFGSWDVAYGGYGSVTDTPCPADYDGDHKADLAVRFHDGWYRIDKSSNGFGSWDVQVGGYGSVADLPEPADYNGDGYDDISIWYADSNWRIDYVDITQPNLGLGSWNVQVSGYGIPGSQPCPADYDGDGKADLAILTPSSSYWCIDYARDGFGSWNWAGSGYGGNNDAVAMPADYDGDTKADLGQYRQAAGQFCVDYTGAGLGSWDLCTGTLPSNMAQPAPLAMNFAVKTLSFDFVATNPVRRQAELTFTLPELQDISISIYDVSGRRVWTLGPVAYIAGTHTVTWSRTSLTGQSIGAGVYFVRFSSILHSVTRTIVVL